VVIVIEDCVAGTGKIAKKRKKAMKIPDRSSNITLYALCSRYWAILIPMNRAANPASTYSIILPSH
jgi:hypothetical protein